MDKKKSKQVSLFRGSFIVSLLSRFADFVYKKGQTGVVGEALTAYDAENKALHRGFFAGLADRLIFSKKLKHSIAKKSEQSVFVYGVQSIFRRLAGLSMRFYGVLLFCFGASGAAVSVFKYARDKVTDFPSVDIFCTCLLLACGLIALLSKDSFSNLLLENRFLSCIVFDILGARRSVFDEIERVRGNKLFAVVLGLLLGVLTYAIPPAFIILAFFAVLLLYTVVVIPEIGVVAAFFALAFLPTMVLVAMVAFTFICYALKLVRGKRTFRFSLIDASVLAFMAFMLMGGFASAGGSGSIKPALVYCCFMMGYFLVVNLIRSEMWIKRSVYAIIFSASIVALYGIYENFFGSLKTTWQDTEMFEDISGRVISTFENPNVLGEYLVMVIPFILSAIIVSKRKSAKAANLFFLAACCLCLVYTWSRGAWLGIIFSLIIFLIVSTSKSIILGIIGVAALPFAPLVLPSSILNRITSIGNVGDSSTLYRVHIWEGAMKLAQSFNLSGIGVGTEAFSKVYPDYSLSGIEKAPHAHNLFLQTWIEIGLPGLIVLIVTILIFIQCSFSFFKKSAGGQMKTGKFLSLAGFCGIMGVLLQGFTDYIWYNYRVYLMFWLIIGLTVAIQNFSVEDSRPGVESRI